MRRARDIRDITWLALRLLNLTLLVVIAGTTGLVLGTYSGIAEMIPRARDLGDIQQGLSSQVFSADGELLATMATENRQFVPLEKIPESLQLAAIATEDQQFYEHVGIDPRAIARALAHDVIALGPRQGGSTITQQLVRNVYLTRKKTFARKLAEAVLAVQLERAYTKPEILELYLNQIYFGEGAYGVQIAAKTYFAKEASQLSLAECALLAGLPKRPEYYSPFEDEQRAIDRRNLVLSLMQEQGCITSAEMQKAREAPLKLREERKPLRLSNFEAPYFTNYVLRQVRTKYGPEALLRGGLRIHTTLNLEMQKAAEEAVQWGLAEAKRRRFQADQMALAALDVRTGAIKAMVGGADYGENQYNIAVQGGRQAGSSFKPFVYTAALEWGYGPDSLVNDSPVTYRGAGGKPWSPRNYDGKYHGQVTFRKALAQSYNVCAVKVADMVGIGAVIATAERMGIWHSMDSYLPLAIGYSNVTPLEMASAYSVFATRGIRTEPYAIHKIVDARGRTIEEHSVARWRAVDEDVANQMVDMLVSVVTSGTGTSARSQYRGWAAGKTGTSNEYKDAWFIGFTEDLCAAVWMGNEEFKSTRPGGKGVSGATIPAPVWGRFMRRAQPIIAAAREAEERPRIVNISPDDRGAPAAPAPPGTAPVPADSSAEPETTEMGSDRFVTVRICPISGMLAGTGCPSSVEVRYDLEAGGNPPETACDLHRPAPGTEGVAPETPSRPRRQPAGGADVDLSVCAITGKLATPYCPVIVSRRFSSGQAPTETCDRHSRRSPGR